MVTQFSRLAKIVFHWGATPADSCGLKVFHDRTRLVATLEVFWGEHCPLTAFIVWAMLPGAQVQKHTTQRPNDPIYGDKERHRVADLECLFGLPMAKLAPWVGASAYCRFLEDVKFQPLLSDEYAFMWTVLGVPHPTHPADCWPWFRVMCSIIHMLREAASIEDVWDGVRSSVPVNTVATRQPTDTENQACLIGIFSVLCWGSITLQPILSWDDLGSTPRLLVRQPSQSQTGDHHQHGLRMDIVPRPIHAIFRNF